MDEQSHEANKELDCLITVNDGSYMTCDMIEADASDKEDQTQEDA